MPIFKKSPDSATQIPRPDVRALTVTAMMAALTVALRPLTFYLGVNWLRVSFLILPIAFAGMLLGAPYAAAAAAVGDVAGYFLFPSGGSFFPGFTITAILEGLCCGLILHKNPASLRRILLCNAVLAVPIHGFLNNFWHSFFLNPNAYFPTLAFRLLKEAILYPVFVFLFFVMAKFVLPKVRRLM